MANRGRPARPLLPDFLAALVRLYLREADGNLRKATRQLSADLHKMRVLGSASHLRNSFMKPTSDESWRFFIGEVVDDIFKQSGSKEKALRIILDERMKDIFASFLRLTVRRLYPDVADQPNTISAEKKGQFVRLKGQQPHSNQGYSNSSQ